MAKIWAHSGDSHFLEPEDLFQQILPAALAERMPWSERDGDDEIVHVDGKTSPPQAAEARHEEGQRRARHHGAQHATTRRARHPGAPARPRPRRGVGRGHLPLARALEPLDQGPGAGARGQPRRERVDRRGDPGRGARPPRPDRAAARCSRCSTRSTRCTTPPRSVCTRSPCPPDCRRGSTTTTATPGNRCGRRSTRPVSCSRSTSAPTAATPRRCTAAPVARCSTTSRRRSAGSARR